MPELDSYYVTCSDCGWGSYRKAESPDEVNRKPCPNCGGGVVVKNRRREGARGPVPEPLASYHGTRRGYQRGCTRAEDCPMPKGRTCQDEERRYQRERYEVRKREELAS